MVDHINITVCAECLCACCWQGEFMCQKARDADITTRTVAELKALDRENPDWWPKDAGLSRRQCRELTREAARLNAERQSSTGQAEDRQARCSQHGIQPAVKRGNKYYCSACYGTGQAKPAGSEEGKP